MYIYAHWYFLLVRRECEGENDVKPKLLMTASTFPRWEGDTEPRFVLDLAKSLLPYFDVTVLAPDCPDAAKREDLEGVHVIRYGYFPIRSWETLCYPGAIVPRIKEKKVRALLVPFLVLSLWAKLLCIRKNYDVIHAHWFIPQGIVQSCFNNPPFIVTGHGGDVTGMNKGIMRKLKARVLKRAAGVTAVSNHLADVLHEIDPDKKIEILPMGCDTSKFGPEHRVENYFQQGDKKVVLFVGRLAEKKGVTYLIEAMKQVEDAILIIAGDGPLHEQLVEQAKPLGDQVRFIGSKTHQELATVYASADVFAAPSVQAKNGDIEGYGLVFLEAMSSSLPVVASRSGGIPDLVHDGENGLLAEPGNPDDLAKALNRMLKDESLRKTLAAHGFDTAKEHDYSMVGKRYAELLNKIITKGK